MPSLNDSILNKKLIAFAGGDQRAGADLYGAMRPVILATVRGRASDLRNELEDVANEVFILMMEAPKRFDHARGTARAFILTILVPEAMQRVRAQMVRPGVVTRHHRKKDKQVVGLFTVPDPLPNPDSVPIEGYGSPQAIEAACDAHAIWTRATPPMRLILGGMTEGKQQAEIAADVKMDRFRVIRLVAGLKRQFGVAA